MTAGIKKRLKIWGANLLGVLCLLLVPIVAPFPGPGGMPLITAGLKLLAINNLWAKRLWDWAETNLTSLSELVFIDNRLCRIGWDLLIYLTLAGGTYTFIWLESLDLGSFDLQLFVISHNSIWQTLLTTVLFFFVLAWFRNRYRWRRLVGFLKIKASKHWPGGGLPDKALTLHQPWASLVAAGAKTIETRSWQPPADLVGQRIAIHAGKQLATQLPKKFQQAVAKHLGQDWRTTVPRGAVIATAKLEKTTQATGRAARRRSPVRRLLDWPLAVAPIKCPASRTAPARPRLAEALELRRRPPDKNE